METEGWNDLAKLRWPSLIAEAAKDMTFHIVHGRTESWLFPETLQGDMSSAVQGSAQIRAYIYARNALIELHKRVADAVETGDAASPAIMAAIEPYLALDVALRGNVVALSAMKEITVDKWAASEAYKSALRAAADDLLHRKGARAVMELGSVDD